MTEAPLIVGILNVSPDSFSERPNTQPHAPSSHPNLEKIIESCRNLIAQRPDVIEVGAESTRPGATPLTATEELDRIATIFPTIARLVKESNITLAIDTRYGKTASYAVEKGALLINDVSGCSDPEMAKLLKDTLPNDVYYVAMHSLTVPADQSIIISGDPVEEIVGWVHHISNKIISNGLPSDRLIIDPGIGFGKNAEQSLAIIGSLDRIRKEGGFPVYVGYSRKSCLAFSPNQHPADRDLETHVITGLIAQCNISYLRVHDVSGTRRAIEISRKLRNQTQALTLSSDKSEKGLLASTIGDVRLSSLVTELVEIDGSTGA